MPWTDGISNAFAALAGGDAIEARERARYQEALARRSLLDQKVLGETARTDIANQKRDAIQQFAEMFANDPRARSIILGGLGRDFSAYQQGFGREQQNTARGDAYGMVTQQNPNIDAFNMLQSIASGGTIGTSEFNVPGQVAATIGKTNAQAGAAGAAAGASNSLAALRGEQQRFVAPVANSVVDKNYAAAGLAGAREAQVAPLAAATIDARNAAADKSRATTPFSVNPQGTAEMLLSLVGNLPGVVTPGAQPPPAAAPAAPAPVDAITSLTGAPAAPATPTRRVVVRNAEDLKMAQAAIAAALDAGYDEEAVLAKAREWGLVIQGDQQTP